MGTRTREECNHRERNVMENTEAVIVASKKIGLEVNAAKAKYHT
jgi:hypothetical protein